MVSLIITYTDSPESIIAPSVRVITFFSAFLSSLLTTRSTGAKGWLTGAINGAINIIILMLIGMAFYGNLSFSTSNLLMILYGAIAGMAGGIIGVNLKA